MKNVEKTDSVTLGETKYPKGKHPNSVANMAPLIRTKEQAQALAAKSNAVQAAKRSELRREARKYTKLAIETLVDVCTNGKNAAARVNAANALLDRGYGRTRIATEEKSETATKIQVTFGDADNPPTATVLSASRKVEDDEYSDGDEELDAEDSFDDGDTLD